MNGTWIHLNLKTIEILKDQTQKINTCSKSTVETLEQGVICLKLTLTTVEGWSGADRVPWYKFQANIYLIKVNNIYSRISCAICSKLIINSTEWRCPHVFIDNFEHVSLLILSSASSVDLGHGFVW